MNIVLSLAQYFWYLQGALQVRDKIASLFERGGASFEELWESFWVKIFKYKLNMFYTYDADD